MVGVVEGFRWALLGQGEFPGLSLAFGTAIGVIVFVIGGMIFRRIERSFADVI